MDSVYAVKPHSHLCLFHVIHIWNTDQIRGPTKEQTILTLHFTIHNNLNTDMMYWQLSCH